MDDKIVENNIRELRKKAGLTQAQLAKKIGISQVHMGRLENNARSMDLEQVENIAKALNVSPAQILPKQWITAEEITPEEMEMLRAFRKLAAAQNTDNANVSQPEENKKHSPQSSQPPQKSNER